MKIDFKTCSEEELWKFVASHLKRKGIDTVLVGGAVVSIYTKGAYKSGDLDLVKTSLFVDKLPEAMKEIGFDRKSQRHFKHPDCDHIFVEFPGSFLEIGDDNQISPDEMDVEGTKIKILSPTDCVKDRLASYIYFKARECFDQAVMVARKHPIKFEEVRRWCKRENRKDIYEDFSTAIKAEG